MYALLFSFFDVSVVYSVLLGIQGGRKTRSLHFFNAYAVKDRVDCSKLACTNVSSSGMSLDVSKILPNDEDWYQLNQNCTTLLSRVLVDYVPFFEPFQAAVCRHIKHDQSKAMKQKSIVVRYQYA